VTSHSTVKQHLANARSKVGAETTAQLVWILATRLPEPEGEDSRGPSDRLGSACRLAADPAAPSTDARGPLPSGRDQPPRQTDEKLVVSEIRLPLESKT
jgi:hypothetical protein